MLRKHEGFSFQLTAARRRLVASVNSVSSSIRFQLTAARRRLVPPDLAFLKRFAFQLTAARRRLVKRLGSA